MDAHAVSHTVGQDLRRLRRLRGLKQGHVAELLGVTQATVSRWERGLAWPDETHAARIAALLSPGRAGQDAALKRLVQRSRDPVHLICDRSHRLLAASAAREAEWTVSASTVLGQPLLSYATPQILDAEAGLAGTGWYDRPDGVLDLETETNHRPDLLIRRSRMRWERILLEDGTAGRLVTTLRWGGPAPEATKG
ncbi:helix-turn-helix transcriptional regulator [Nitrospirillum viridazoti]|uniref:Transcriptional regulator n=1 Tax=Nitrospirillum viridazoti CBAmc TaxID=1441467 RepID=A0A248JS95_9PROT|nr:helix-turn-helix transcriptional regulator [Nitrospirillum amazonense]ASG21565.1 transcriptional regulator [Nitrospirillum amazonense CBAmc]TWB42297.1 helix-turn-helix protein [Nitrospirillum amazonense]